MRAAIVAGVLVLATPGVASAADTVPVTVKVKNCDGCSIMATWSKGGKSTSKYRGATRKVKNGTVRFDIPSGYWMYFTGTSPKAAVDAATILVTQYVGSSEGASVSPAKSRTFNDGAYYCLRASKQTIKARAAFVKAGRSTLLSLWANPQLAMDGNTANDGIKGVYGTQNTLICQGKYY
jgi:hypothetical protein